jgi:5-methylcytosine-specific restriction endonuclease McrA
LSQIFEASDGTCGICGDVVDPDLKWPDPMSPSRDHIVPLVAGGPNSMDNIQLAHLRCNLRKGHRD